MANASKNRTIVIMLSLGIPNFAASADADLIKVMPLGNGLTAGGSATHNGGYRFPLWELIETGPLAGTIDFVGSLQKGPNPPSAANFFFDPDHEGHSGNTVAETLTNVGPNNTSTIEDVLNAEIPDVILLHIGTVNAAQGNHTNANAVPTALADLQELIDRTFATLPSVKLCLALIVGPEDDNSTNYQFVEDYNAGIPAIVSQELSDGNDVSTVDIFGGSGISYGIGSSDFVDPFNLSDAGYDKMADVWYQHFLDVGVPEPATLSFVGCALLLCDAKCSLPTRFDSARRGR